jgi:hypothetical protein
MYWGWLIVTVYVPLSRALTAQFPSLAACVVATHRPSTSVPRRMQIPLPPRRAPVSSPTVPHIPPRNDGARTIGSSKARQASTSVVAHRWWLQASAGSIGSRPTHRVQTLPSPRAHSITVPPDERRPVTGVCRPSSIIVVVSGMELLSRHPVTAHPWPHGHRATKSSVVKSWYTVRAGRTAAMPMVRRSRCSSARRDICTLVFFL